MENIEFTLTRSISVDGMEIPSNTTGSIVDYIDDNNIYVVIGNTYCFLTRMQISLVEY